MSQRKQPIWRCRGWDCGAVFVAGEEDLIVQHVRDCDTTDGAGNPLPQDDVENQRVASFLADLPAAVRGHAEGALRLAYTHGWQDATASLEATGADLLHDALAEHDQPPPRRPYL